MMDTPHAHTPYDAPTIAIAHAHADTLNASVGALQRLGAPYLNADGWQYPIGEDVMDYVDALHTLASFVALMLPLDRDGR